VTLYEDSPGYFYDDTHKRWSLFKMNDGQWRLEDLAPDSYSDHPTFAAAIAALKSHVGDVTVHRKKARMEMKQALLKLAQENPEFRKSLIAELGHDKTADRWENKPKGWTDASRKKFWNSLTSAAPKHKVTECIKRMNKHMGGNAGAFCASLADRVIPGWRQEAAKDRAKKAAGGFILMKKSRALPAGKAKAKDAYKGKVYKTQKEAETDAEKLTKRNPVGFAVIKLGSSLTQPLSLRRDSGTTGSDEDEWLDVEEVKKHCPPCAEKMARNGIRKVKASALRIAMQR
jgi:hypothetical protein